MHGPSLVRGKNLARVQWFSGWSLLVVAIALYSVAFAIGLVGLLLILEAVVNKGR